jgi:hypothetical protein
VTFASPKINIWDMLLEFWGYAFIILPYTKPVNDLKKGLFAALAAAGKFLMHKSAIFNWKHEALDLRGQARVQ